MLNVINLVGRLTADPKYSVTPSGTSCCSFTLACQRDFGDKETDFINVVAWKQTAEFVTKHFTKGAMMCVSGRLQIRTWEKDGQKRSAAEVVANNCYFYGKADKPAGAAPAAEEPAGNYAIIEEEDGNLPF